jgi:heme/copper-type cytochrome/quinol oxidase subunit 3
MIINENLNFKAMSENVVGVIFFIISGAVLFGVMYVYYTTRNRERMALIEKNADPSILKPGSNGSFKLFAIKFGMLLMGVGLGILVGNILTATTVLKEEVAYFSMIFLFGGAGLFTSYFVGKKLQK